MVKIRLDRSESLVYLARDGAEFFVLEPDEVPEVITSLIAVNEELKHVDE